VHPVHPLPHLAVVRVLTAGGPYRADDVLSLAFVEPTAGRLVPHAGFEATLAPLEAAVVPESISVRILRAAAQYAVGTVLTLSFVDPAVARIHAQTFDGAPLLNPASSTTDAPHVNRVAVEADFVRAAHSPTARASSVVNARNEPGGGDETPSFADGASAEFGRSDVREPALSWEPQVAPTAQTREPFVATAEHGDSAPPADVVTSEASGSSSCDIAEVREVDVLQHARLAANENRIATPGVEVRLEWTPERVRRFITVVDKLFTVERLGWYRHVLAMRLLVPDRITCGDAANDIETMRHLHALRAASVETLGRPLLEAFMPSFVVTAEWLQSLDSPSAARALAGVRNAIEPFVTADSTPHGASVGATWTVGRIDRGDFLRAPATSVEALMPVLIASASVHRALGERLGAYRRTLIEVFGQTAQAAEAVRLGAMAQPNHSLDDRLWQLVSTIGETFGDRAVA